jgi:histidinol-phosphate aminotransferase
MTGLPIRDDLRVLTPYGAPQIDVPVRLNTNENPYPMPADTAAALEKALGAQIEGLNRYPDRDAVALREDLAAYLNSESAEHPRLTAANVWAANGSNEVQQQILQTFGGPGRVAMGFSPSYSMHRLLALGTATGWIDGARDDEFGLAADAAAAQVRKRRPDIVFICSPNNPTGTALPPDVLDAILREAPGMVVVDEAYAEFRRDGTPSALTLLPGRERLIVTRTMSKAFACAGLRLGYLAAAPSVVDALALVRLPYHLSTLTQAAARAALSHAPALLGTVGELRRGRDRLVAELRSRGLTVAESDANFVLFGGLPIDAPSMWRRLLDRGVLIRDVGLPGWLRVSVGTVEESAAFLGALDAALGREGIS